MVKVLTTILSFLFVAGCSFRNHGHNQDKVYFEEHEITADEKSKVEQRINNYNQFVDSSFFKRNGIFLVYDTESDVVSREDYIYFFDEDAYSIEACYLEHLPGKNVVECSKFDVPQNILLRLHNVDFISKPIVVAKLNRRNNTGPAYPKIFLMKKSGTEKQFALFYNLRSCLKTVCLKNDKNEVPKQYEDYVFLFDVANYLTYEIGFHEGRVTENIRDSVYNVYFELLKKSGL
ncbi:MAG: hypothetical protein J6T54_09420 [Fibrobacter sp.]|nr:hypothetical protein [Fibrobacter sp.]